jgi:hypothetical protein
MTTMAAGGGRPGRVDRGAQPPGQRVRVAAGHAVLADGGTVDYSVLRACGTGRAG